MGNPHWIDEHLTSPEERAARISAAKEQEVRESRRRTLRLVFLKLPIGLFLVALLGSGTAVTLHYYGFIDLTAYVPQLPRKVDRAPLIAGAPASDADGAGLLGSEQGQRPADVSATLDVVPVANEGPTAPAGQPIPAAHADHLLQGLAIMGRELAETDATITFLKSTLSTRPGSPTWPAPWTDLEHLLAIEYFAQTHPNMPPGQVWDCKNAHNAWVANVGNDRKRLADLTAKHNSLTARQDKAKAELAQEK